MTYRQLLAAIAEAERRQSEYQDAREAVGQAERNHRLAARTRRHGPNLDPLLWKLDELEALQNSADSALSEEIDWSSL